MPESFLVTWWLLFLLGTVGVEGEHEGQIRLTDGNVGSGRVQVYHDDNWGNICADYWDINDATVVCRQLGFPSALSSYNISSKDDGTPIWLDNVRCDGIEGYLTDCATNGWGTANCDTENYDTAAVECQTHAMNGDVCLRSEHGSKETNETQGYVQILQNGEWLNICDPNWGSTESIVVCRQLWLISAINFMSHAITGTDIIKCNGKEDKLDKCIIKLDSGCKESVHVTCSQNNPDSAGDALYNPQEFCDKTFNTIQVDIDSSDKNQVNLTTIRDSFDICIGAVPAEIICVDNGTSSTSTTGTTCNRRSGFTCDNQINKRCQHYEITAKCPCKNPTELTKMCTYLGMEYSPGETRQGDANCLACTCLADGTWVCDNNVNFCQNQQFPKGPPPFEATCYRPDGCEYPPENRTCMLSDWVIEWYIGGNSPLCEGCLFNYTDVNNTYEEHYQPKGCTDCILLDGISRAVAVVNRQMPGPAVQVCEGDRIIVKVINMMSKDPTPGTTIHWHGMFMDGTQYMDGAFMVTQCPIPFAEAFIYNFTALPHGTHWWHSHSGLQRGEGLHGAFIVRQPKEIDANGLLYDFDKPEHVVVVQDWAHRMGVNHFVRDFYQDFDASPGAILINGRGGQTIPEEIRPLWCGDSNTDLKACPVPRYAQFDVTRDKRFRFRVISTATSRGCGLRVSVDNHNMTIIATDGASTKPYTTRYFVIWNAERYDFVLNADQEPGNYWMRVQGVKGPGHNGSPCKNLDALAIIHYENTELQLPNTTDRFPGMNKRNNVVNSCHVSDGDGPPSFIDQLDSSDAGAPPGWDVNKPDETFYVGLNFGDDNVNFLPQLNNITFRVPSRPFLLQNDNPMEKLEMCHLENEPKNQTYFESCGDGHCECSHIINVPLNKTVEFFFVNTPLAFSDFDACHPMHLHGYNYRVVAQGKFDKTKFRNSVEHVRALNLKGMIKRKALTSSIQKDTVAVPENGYTAIQFKAENPGWWFLHCHFEIHLVLGMVLVIHVGEPKDLPPRPLSFPECGNWPIPRANDGEAYIWSEEEAGNIDPDESSLFKAVNATLVQSKAFLKDALNRQFKEFQVANNRLKTDPVSGYHYFLFKINTGNDWYVHVQLRASTNPNNPAPVLLACLDSLNADVPLEPIDVLSSKNRCKPPRKRFICASANSLYNSGGIDSVLTSLLFTVIVEYWYL